MIEIWLGSKYAFKVVSTMLGNTKKMQSANNIDRKDFSISHVDQNNDKPHSFILHKAHAV